MKLNKNQARAVNHFQGPMMVLAGPGSGKTTVIAHRVRQLVEQRNVPPGEITVITFTKAASAAMKEQFESLTGGSGKSGRNQVNFGTFHAFFFKIIRRAFGYTLENVLANEQRRDLIMRAARRTNIFRDDEEDFLQTVSSEISLVKNELFDIEHYHSASMGGEDFIALYKSYESLKTENQKIDFDDMLIQCYNLLLTDEQTLSYWRGLLKFILIDEFQDINRVQYECVKLLAQPPCNIFVVGDDDQSIYKFRGAKPEFLSRFSEEFQDTETIVLDTNYRSTEKIISACNKIIGGNSMRYAKEMKGVNRLGTNPCLLTSKDIAEEALNIARAIQKRAGLVSINDIAVIYRTNMQGRAFADVLMDLNIPYNMKDDMPDIYKHWLNKDICAYLRLAFDQTLDGDLERILNKPARYIGKGIIAAAKKSGTGLLDYLYRDNALKSWQVSRLDELMFHLSAVKSRQTTDAIAYIRRSIGYQEAVKQYADYKKLNPKGLIEVLDELQEAAKHYPKIEDYLAHVTQVGVQRAKTDRKKRIGGVTLSTMHSAKGLEFDTVFVAGCVEGVVPHEKSKTAAQIEEERRLLYVAMTRAKNNLILSVVESRYELEAKPSTFLEPVFKPEKKYAGKR